MILYHGTSSKYLKSILKKGLKPRGQRRDGNWSETIKSNPSAVYLTDAYPLHFCMNAGKGTGNYLILEIDTEDLDKWKFAPDEDFLEQVTRSDKQWDIYEQSMEERTKFFRDRAQTDFPHHWRDSLKGMGTCCYYGSIPVSAIKRYALVRPSATVVMASDPTITVINYAIKGGYYRALSRKIFGDPLGDELCTETPEGLIIDGHQVLSEHDRLEALPLDGVAVKELQPT